MNAFSISAFQDLEIINLPNWKARMFPRIQVHDLEEVVSILSAKHRHQRSFLKLHGLKYMSHEAYKPQEANSNYQLEEKLN